MGLSAKPVFFCRGANDLSRRSVTKTDAPLHPWRPRMRDFVLASGMRVLWWFDSCVAKFHPLPPFLATGGMKFAPRVPHWGKFPQTPLSRRSLVRRRIAAACNARRNSYGVTAILELEICHCSNISFEQWIFFLPILPSEFILR